MEGDKYSQPWALEEGSVSLPEAVKSHQHQYRNESAAPALEKSVGFKTPEKSFHWLLSLLKY